MSKLWLLVAGLAVVYLLMWAALRDDRPKPPSDVEQLQVTPSSEIEVLSGLAQRDAIARNESGVTLERESIRPGYFSGDDLRPISPRSAGARPGFVITYQAKRDGKAVARLVYHAVAPDRVVFVSQEKL